MGQRARILTLILGFDGWKVKATFFDTAGGKRLEAVGGFAVLRETRLVLVVERRAMYRLLGVSRPGYHAYAKRLPSPRGSDAEKLFHAIREIFTRTGETYGSPRVLR